jgi:hypothetical protein
VGTPRRIGFAAFVLILAAPVSMAPVEAHTGGGFAFEWGVRAGDGGSTVVAGLVTSHKVERQLNIQVTATWRVGATVVATETAPAFMSNLAPHASSPFKIVETDDVEGATLMLSATGTDTFQTWVGQIGFEPGTLTDDTYTGTMRNEGTLLDVAIAEIQVFAVRRQGGIIVDAAGSEPTTELLEVGAETTFTIEFDDVPGDAVGGFIAEAPSWGWTSWNNLFADLGTSNFAAEIAWMADAGISSGCRFEGFCPKFLVLREEMAVFLNRALELPPASEPPPFTDIASRPLRVREAVANLYEAGITAGCTPTTFCPREIVTRGQMSAFIVTGYALEPIPGPGPFIDDDGHFSERFNNRMEADGITGGCAASAYCPHNPVLREQMAKFLFEAEN